MYTYCIGLQYEPQLNMTYLEIAIGINLDINIDIELNIDQWFPTWG